MAGAGAAPWFTGIEDSSTPIFAKIWSTASSSSENIPDFFDCTGATCGAAGGAAIPGIEGIPGIAGGAGAGSGD